MSELLPIPRPQGRPRKGSSPLPMFENESEKNMNAQSPQFAPASASEQPFTVDKIKPAPIAQSAPPMVYRWIIIHSDEDSKEDYFGGVNGVPLHVKRDVKVIMPESHINQLREAKVPGYYNVPGAGTFATPPHTRYKITEMGEAAEAEFVKMLNEGRLISRTQMPRVTPLMRQMQRAMSSMNL